MMSLEMRFFRGVLATLAVISMLVCSGCGGEERGDPGAGDADRGRDIYVKRCAQCHGDTGEGDGPGAAYMLPRPRKLNGGNNYKFRTTAYAALPTDWDLFDAITKGFPGSAMPGFAELPEQERWDLVAYLKEMNPLFKVDQLLEQIVPVEGVIGAEAPDESEELIEQGKAYYVASKCAQCHGENGRGNGDGAQGIVDSTNTQNLPANLSNAEHFRSGSSVEDLYKFLSTYPTGAGMPQFTIEDPVDRWALAYYIRSLGPPEKEERDEVIRAKRVDSIPDGGDDESWAAAAPARFKTLSNVIEPPRLFWPSVEFVTVQALYTEHEVALRVQWDDRTHSKGSNMDGSVYADPWLVKPIKQDTDKKDADKKDADPKDADKKDADKKDGDKKDGDKKDGDKKDGDKVDKDGDKKDADKAVKPCTGVYKDTDHPDQLAIQFPARKDKANARPYFLMGDRKRAVNLWSWRADQGDTSFKEQNAKGFATIKDQPESSQSLAGKATYDDGRYTVIIRRSLKTDDPKNDVTFVPGDFVPIGFNLWDGSRGEVGQRRALTTWYWLQLEPETPKKAYYVPPITFAVTLILMLLLVRWTRRRTATQPEVTVPVDSAPVA